MRTNILDRDRTGRCKGECRDRVNEGRRDRQDRIEASSFDAPDSYPNAEWARSNRDFPGGFGGHGH